MRTLAVAASPGDAEFACGGTLLRVKAGGDAIAICTIANGNSTGDGIPPRQLAATRREEAESAAESLGAELFWMDHSDFAVSNDAVTRLKLMEVLRTFRPQVVLAPAALGPVRDARNAWPLVVEATQMAATPNARTEQPALETRPYLAAYDPSWVAGFPPTIYVDVSDVAEAKLAVLEAYPSLLEWRQMHDAVDLLAAARTLGAYRGLQAQVAMAEAFAFDPSDGRAPTERVLP